MSSDEPAAPAAQKSKKISKQEVDSRKNELKKMGDFMQSVDDLLRKIKQKPSIYNSAMMAPLRQFCEYRDNHRSLFTGLIGEASSLHPVNGGEVTVEATPGYIAAIADCGDTDTFSQPILQVITAETSFHKSKFKVTYDKPQQPVKVTHSWTVIIM